MEHGMHRLNTDWRHRYVVVARRSPEYRSFMNALRSFPARLCETLRTSASLR